MNHSQWGTLKSMFNLWVALPGAHKSIHPEVESNKICLFRLTISQMWIYFYVKERCSETGSLETTQLKDDTTKERTCWVVCVRSCVWFKVGCFRQRFKELHSISHLYIATEMPVEVKWMVRVEAAAARRTKSLWPVLYDWALRWTLLSRAH